MGEAVEANHSPQHTNHPESTEIGRAQPGSLAESGGLNGESAEGDIAVDGGGFEGHDREHEAKKRRRFVRRETFVLDSSLDAECAQEVRARETEVSIESSLHVLWQRREFFKQRFHREEVHIDVAAVVELERRREQALVERQRALELKESAMRDLEAKRTKALKIKEVTDEKNRQELEFKRLKQLQRLSLVEAAKLDRLLKEQRDHDAKQRLAVAAKLKKMNQTEEEKRAEAVAKEKERIAAARQAKRQAEEAKRAAVRQEIERRRKEKEAEKEAARVAAAQRQKELLEKKKAKMAADKEKAAEKKRAAQAAKSKEDGASSRLTSAATTSDTAPPTADSSVVGTPATASHAPHAQRPSPILLSGAEDTAGAGAVSVLSLGSRTSVGSTTSEGGAGGPPGSLGGGPLGAPPKTEAAKETTLVSSLLLGGLRSPRNPVTSEATPTRSPRKGKKDEATPRVKRKPKAVMVDAESQTEEESEPEVAKPLRRQSSLYMFKKEANGWIDTKARPTPVTATLEEGDEGAEDSDGGAVLPAAAADGPGSKAEAAAKPRASKRAAKGRKKAAGADKPGDSDAPTASGSEKSPRRKGKAIAVRAPRNTNNNTDRHSGSESDRSPRKHAKGKKATARGVGKNTAATAASARSESDGDPDRSPRKVALPTPRAPRGKGGRDEDGSGSDASPRNKKGSRALANAAQQGEHQSSQVSGDATAAAGKAIAPQPESNSERPAPRPRLGRRRSVLKQLDSATVLYDESHDAVKQRVFGSEEEAAAANTRAGEEAGGAAPAAAKKGAKRGGGKRRTQGGHSSGREGAENSDSASDRQLRGAARVGRRPLRHRPSDTSDSASQRREGARSSKAATTANTTTATADARQRHHHHHHHQGLAAHVGRSRAKQRAGSDASVSSVGPWAGDGFDSSASPRLSESELAQRRLAAGHTEGTTDDSEGGAGVSGSESDRPAAMRSHGDREEAATKRRERRRGSDRGRGDAGDGVRREKGVRANQLSTKIQKAEGHVRRRKPTPPSFVLPNFSQVLKLKDIDNLLQASSAPDPFPMAAEGGAIFDDDDDGPALGGFLSDRTDLHSHTDPLADFVPVPPNTERPSYGSPWSPNSTRQAPNDDGWDAGSEDSVDMSAVWAPIDGNVYCGPASLGFPRISESRALDSVVLSSSPMVEVSSWADAKARMPRRRQRRAHRHAAPVLPLVPVVDHPKAWGAPRTTREQQQCRQRQLEFMAQVRDDQVVTSLREATVQRQRAEREKKRAIAKAAQMRDDAARTLQAVYKRFRRRRPNIAHGYTQDHLSRSLGARDFAGDGQDSHLLRFDERMAALPDIPKHKHDASHTHTVEDKRTVGHPRHSLSSTTPAPARMRPQMPPLPPLASQAVVKVPPAPLGSDASVATTVSCEADVISVDLVIGNPSVSPQPPPQPRTHKPAGSCRAGKSMAALDDAMLLVAESAFWSLEQDASRHHQQQETAAEVRRSILNFDHQPPRNLL